jgi:hypothetical protein
VVATNRSVKWAIAGGPGEIEKMEKSNSAVDWQRTLPVGGQRLAAIPIATTGRNVAFGAL